MIKVVAKNFLKADCVSKAIEITEKLVTETRKEEGCLVYEFFQDIENPCVVTMIESWTTQEALDLHLKSEHIKEFFSLTTSLIEKDAEINVYKQVY